MNTENLEKNPQNLEKQESALILKNFGFKNETIINWIIDNFKDKKRS